MAPPSTDRVPFKSQGDGGTGQRTYWERLAYSSTENVDSRATDLLSPNYAFAQVAVPSSPKIPMKLRLHLLGELLTGT